MSIYFRVILALVFSLFLTNCNVDSDGKSSELATANSDVKNQEVANTGLSVDYVVPASRKLKISSCLSTGSFGLICDPFRDASCDGINDQSAQVGSSGAGRPSVDFPTTVNKEKQIACISKIVDEEVQKVKLKTGSLILEPRGCEGPSCEGPSCDGH